MAKKKANHIHKYERKQVGSLTIYKCAVTNCNHYVGEQLVLHRLSVCWTCNEPFEITHATIRMKRPRCQVCRKGKEKIAKQDRLDELLNSPDLLSRVIK